VPRNSKGEKMKIKTSENKIADHHYTSADAGVMISGTLSNIPYESYVTMATDAGVKIIKETVYTMNRIKLHDRLNKVASGTITVEEFMNVVQGEVLRTETGM